MLRSIAVRRRHISTKRIRSEASRSMRACAAAVLILRDARTPARICGRACAFALLRMRTAITYKSYSLFKQPSSFPRRVFAPGFCILASLTRNEGWRSAERRTDACEASVGPALSGQARHLARRLASPYGGRPPPGAHTVAILVVGAALPLTGIAAGSVTASSSHPGRSARRRGPCLPGRRLRIAAAGRHASLRPQDRL